MHSPSTLGHGLIFKCHFEINPRTFFPPTFICVRSEDRIQKREKWLKNAKLATCNRDTDLVFITRPLLTYFLIKQLKKNVARRSLSALNGTRFFFFSATQLVSCPFWRLELKSFRRPNREEPNKSVTKGFPCHQRRSDDLKRIPLILTSTSKTLFFNWDPTILFFFSSFLSPPCTY